MELHGIRFTRLVITTAVENELLTESVWFINTAVDVPFWH